MREEIRLPDSEHSERSPEREFVIEERSGVPPELFRYCAACDPLVALNELSTLVWRSGTDGKCNFFNKAWLGFTGRRMEEELGDGWAGGVHPDDLQFCIQTYLNAFVKREPFEMTYRLRRHDGEYRWIHDKGSPLITAAGAFTGYIGVCMDITAEKRTLQRLQESERRFLAVANSTNDIVFTLDTNLRHTAVYSKTIHSGELSLDMFFGKSALDIFGPDLGAPHIDAGMKALAGEDVIYRWSSTDKSGKTRYYETSLSPLRDEFGEINGVVGIGRDITEQKTLEVQLFHAQRMESLGALAGGIAHDLNNILAPIVLGVGLLRSKTADEACLKLITMIESNAHRGSRIIKDILSFSRVRPEETSTLDIRRIVEDIERVIRLSFPPSVQLEVNLQNGIRPISGDSTQMHQMLLNLCVNARDAMPNGGALIIKAENITFGADASRLNIEVRPGEYVCLTVRDSGEGISTDTLSKIFDPFFTTKEAGKGTGLGLSTVRGIVRGHGGFIECSSMVGKGSEFRVFLPSIKDAQPAIEPARPTDEFVRGRGETILVVDDELMVRNTIAVSLEEHGYAVVTAADGMEAVSLAAQREKDFDLILCDVTMPLLDGPSTVRALREMGCESEIIIMTGLLNELRDEQVKELSVANLLAKPHTAENLLKTVAAAIARRNKGSALAT